MGETVNETVENKMSRIDQFSRRDTGTEERALQVAEVI